MTPKPREDGKDATSRPASRRGATRSERAQRAILDATRKELAENGYDKLAIERIAAAAGVGKQTIYRWYPSKSALVAEAALPGYVLTPAIEIQDSGNVRRDIGDWVRQFANNSRDPEVMALVRAATAASAESDDTAAQFDPVTAHTQQALEDRLRKGKQAGQLKRGTSVRIVAQTIVGTLLYRILTRQELSPDFVDKLLRTVFDGIGEQPAPKKRRV